MSFVASMLQIHAGVMVWALHFTVIYGFTALTCARGLPLATVPWVMAIATVAAVTACTGIALAGLRHAGRFESWMSAALAGLALIAIVWEALPVLLVPICA